MTSTIGLFLVALVTCGLTSEVPHIRDTKLPNSVQRHVARSGVVDFYFILEEVIHDLGRQHGTSVSWWDYTGFFARQNKEYQQYEKFKVMVNADQLVYDEPVQVSDKEETTSESSYHNYLNITTSRNFYFQVRTPQKYTWIPENGLDVYPTPWGSGALPLELQDRDFVMRVGLDAGASQYVDDETFQLDFSLDVPPTTKVQVIWKTVEREVSASWKANVTLSGHVAVFFAQPVDGQQLHFYQVHNLVAGDGLTPQVTPQGPALLFEASGYFVGTRTLRLNREFYLDPL